MSPTLQLVPLAGTQDGPVAVAQASSQPSTTGGPVAPILFPWLKQSNPWAFIVSSIVSPAATAIDDDDDLFPSLYCSMC